MNLLWTKIVTMSILGSLSLIVGFIPMLVAKKVRYIFHKPASETRTPVEISG